MSSLAQSSEEQDIIWQPLPGSQTTVLSHSFVFELLYHGTRGPGKSDTLLMDFAQHCGQGFGAEWRGIIFRQTYKQLQDLIAKSKKWFPRIWAEQVKWNGTDHKWVWKSGEELLLRQFMREDDYWNYHGHEYPFIGWDELTNWPDLGGYKRMISCCRSSNPDMPRKIRSTTNPYGPGHNAVKFYFELPGKDGVMRRRTYKMEDPTTGLPVEEKLIRLTIHGNIYENTILLKAQPTYIAQLRQSARNEAELAAWLEGSWDIVSGGMFDGVWNPKINLVKPFEIPASWRVDRSFDWGSSRPFSVGWWAESDGTDYIDGDGNWRSTVRGDLFRVAEWYGWNGQPNEGLQMLAVDVARGIREREENWFGRRKVHAGPADASIFVTENGVSIASDMAKPIRMDDGRMARGVSWTAADKRSGSRIAGWEATRKMMRAAQDPHPREKPGMFVFNTCDQFQRTVPSLPRDEKKPDDVDTLAEDHIGDEIRYRVRAVGTRAGSATTIGMY